jgi:hypothetical protein
MPARLDPPTGTVMIMLVADNERLAGAGNRLI